jgi:hypothetical protein
VPSKLAIVCSLCPTSEANLAKLWARQMGCDVGRLIARLAILNPMIAASPG